LLPLGLQTVAEVVGRRRPRDQQRVLGRVGAEAVRKSGMSIRYEVGIVWNGGCCGAEDCRGHPIPLSVQKFLTSTEVAVVQLEPGLCYVVEEIVEAGPRVDPGDVPKVVGHVP